MMNGIQFNSRFPAPKIGQTAGPAGGAGGLAADFGKALGELIERTNSLQQQADQAAGKLQSGGDISLPDVMLSMEQADISMRLLVQMRNKVIEAYQEIMRMQV